MKRGHAGCIFLIFWLNVPNDTLFWVVLMPKALHCSIMSCSHVMTSCYDVICDVTWHVCRGYKRAGLRVVGGIPGPTLIG